MVVATNGTRMTEEAMRTALSAHMEAMLWTDERAAAELGCTVTALKSFIEARERTPMGMKLKTKHFLESIGVLEPEPAPIGAPNPSPDLLLSIKPLDDYPFPIGFALVAIDEPSPSANGPAIRMSKHAVYLNSELRLALGKTETVLVAVNEQADTVQIGIAPAKSTWSKNASRVSPRMGNLLGNARSHIGRHVPNGIYPVTKHGDCWLTAAVPKAI